MRTPPAFAIALLFACGRGAVRFDPSASGARGPMEPPATLAPEPSPVGVPARPLAGATPARLAGWQEESDQFDGGYRPTGSPAHEAYIARLAQDLGVLGASEVHLELTRS
jgi:hypothetical protein